jgi:hypothetical protein
MKLNDNAITDQELGYFKIMHQCKQNSDGSCQRCRMVARIRQQDEMIALQRAAIQRSIAAINKYLEAVGAKPEQTRPAVTA